jgi:voltage-gated potassium channel
LIDLPGAVIPIMKSNRFKLIYRGLKKERFFLIVLITLSMIALSSLGVFYFESEAESSIRNIWDGVWWAFVTICTVGYGDKYPITIGGKIIGILLMISGIGLVSMMTATVASVLVEHKLREGKGLEGIKEKGHILVCGWNSNTEEVIAGLLKSEPSSSILLINELKPDELESLGFKYGSKNVHFLRGDFVNEELLKKANIRKAKTVILMADFSGINSKESADNRTILAALAIKSLAPHVRTIAELLEPDNIYHLKRARVDEIIVRGQSASALLAGSVENPGLPGVLAEIIAGSEGNRLIKKKIPAQFVGKKLSEYAEFEKKGNGMIVIGLAQEKRTVRVEDILADTSSAIDNFIREKLMESGKGVMESEQPGKIVLNPKEDHILNTETYAILIK